MAGKAASAAGRERSPSGPATARVAALGRTRECIAKSLGVLGREFRVSGGLSDYASSPTVTGVFSWRAGQARSEVMSGVPVMCSEHVAEWGVRIAYRKCTVRSIEGHAYRGPCLL